MTDKKLGMVGTRAGLRDPRAGFRALVAREGLLPLGTTNGLDVPLRGPVSNGLPVSTKPTVTPPLTGVSKTREAITCVAGVAPTVNNLFSGRSVAAGSTLGSLVTRDAVTAQVRALSDELGAHGQASGVTLALQMNHQFPAILNHGLAVAIFTVLLSAAEREVNARCAISLECHRGRWGLYFTRTPAPQEGGSETKVALVDAPFQVRQWFLTQSKGFVDEYLARCETEYAPRRLALATSAAALNTLRSAASVRNDTEGRAR